MTEFNDRRPRVGVRIRTDKLRVGDHIEYPPLSGKVRSVTGVEPTHSPVVSGMALRETHVSFDNGEGFSAARGRKHTVHRLRGEE